MSAGLKEIVALIPLEQIRAIAKTHLETDAEFQKVVAYLQGAEWAKLVAAVRANPTWQGFKKYLTEAGLDVECLISKIHNVIADAKPSDAAQPSAQGIRQFLDEIIPLIPKDKIMGILNEKLENNDEFKAFYAKVSSDKAKALVEDVRAMEEVKRIAGILKDMGVKVPEIIQFVYIFMGWN